MFCFFRCELFSHNWGNNYLFCTRTRLWNCLCFGMLTMRTAIFHNCLYFRDPLITFLDFSFPWHYKTFSLYPVNVEIEWMEEYPKAKIYKNKPALRNERNGTATIFINQPSEIFESVASRTDKPTREPIFLRGGGGCTQARAVTQRVIKGHQIVVHR